MGDQADNVLLKEYKLLSTAFENYQSTTFKLFPVLVTIVCGLTLFKEINPNLYCLGIPLAIFFILIWLGFCHSMLNYYGIRLLEIEQRINALPGSDMKEKLSFYTFYICEGGKVLYGFNGYVSLMVLVALICMLGSLWQLETSWESIPFVDGIKYFVIVGVAILPIIAIGNMVYAERKYREDKNNIIKKYNIK